MFSHKTSRGSGTALLAVGPDTPFRFHSVRRPKGYPLPPAKQSGMIKTYSGFLRTVRISMIVDDARPARRSREKAPRPTPRPDRSFYSSGKAFGRFGMRSFSPQIMPRPHSHGHIEFNWLTRGTMDYLFDGGPVSVGADCLVAFWAGIPHQTVGLSPETGEGRQLNIYLPMDAFLEMP